MSYSDNPIVTLAAAHRLRFICHHYQAIEHSNFSLPITPRWLKWVKSRLPLMADRQDIHCILGFYIPIAHDITTVAERDYHIPEFRRHILDGMA